MVQVILLNSVIFNLIIIVTTFNVSFFFTLLQTDIIYNKEKVIVQSGHIHFTTIQNSTFILKGDHNLLWADLVLRSWSGQESNSCLFDRCFRFLFLNNDNEI